MKGTWIALAALFAAIAVPSWATPAPEQKLVLTRLTERLYVVEDPFYVKENSAVYIGNSYVTIIGATWTPDTARQLVAEIAKVTPKPVKEVIDTNYNLDRAGGNAYFKTIGANIVSTKMTRRLLAQQGRAMVAETRKAFADYPDVEIVLPDTTFAGDFALQDGAVKGLYLGPSHMPDDIFVYFPNEKVLYGGCVLKEQLGNMAGADPVAYRDTLQRLQGLHLDIRTIIAGHWSWRHGPELIDQYIALLVKYRQ